MLRQAQLRRARLAAMAARAAAQTAPPAEREFRIAGLRAYPLREPVSRRAYTVIRIETAAGIAGYGECPAVTEGELAQAAQLLNGKPATAYEALRRQLDSMPRLQPAVDMALLDIVGKLTKAPLYQVLGGPTRNRARAMTRLEGDSSEALAASLLRARDAGFRAFLVPVPPASAPNQGREFVLGVMRRLEALRAAGSDEVDFVLDGAGVLTPADAASLCRALERFHLLWFDEPSRVSNLGAIRKLSSESVTPIGFGRGVPDAGGFQDLLREDAIDILRPDISLHGVTQIRKLAALAETYYVAVAPHHDGGPIATAAAFHLAAAIPNFFIQQIPLPRAEEDRRMRARITGRPVEVVQDGFATLPTGPGLGIEVDDRLIERLKEKSA